MTLPGRLRPRWTIGRCMIGVAVSALALSGPLQFLLVALTVSFMLLMRLGFSWVKALMAVEVMGAIAIALGLPFFVTALRSNCGMPASGPTNLAVRGTRPAVVRSPLSWRSLGGPVR